MNVNFIECECGAKPADWEIVKDDEESAIYKCKACSRKLELEYLPNGVIAIKAM